MSPPSLEGSSKFMYIRSNVNFYLNDESVLSTWIRKKLTAIALFMTLLTILSMATVFYTAMNISFGVALLIGVPFGAGCNVIWLIILSEKQGTKNQPK